MEEKPKGITWWKAHVEKGIREKQRIAAYQQWNETPEGIAAEKRYNESPKGIASRKQWNESPEGIALLM